MTDRRKKSNALAVTALVLAVIPCLFPIGLIMAIVILAPRSGSTEKRGVALVALIFGLMYTLMLAPLVWMMLPSFADDAGSNDGEVEMVRPTPSTRAQPEKNVAPVGSIISTDARSTGRLGRNRTAELLAQSSDFRPQPPPEPPKPTKPPGPSGRVKVLKGGTKLARKHARAHVDELIDCYDRARVDNPKLAGTMSVTLHVDTDGLLKVSSDGLGSWDLRRCVSTVFHGQVEPPSSGYVTTIKLKMLPPKRRR